MKALSVKQPWADRILLGGKTVEVRTWSTGYRGLLAIHASKEPDPGYEEYRRELVHRTGVILGLVWLSNVRPMYPSDEDAAQARYEPGFVAWHMLAPVALPTPVKARGHQGLWTVRREAEEAIWEETMPCPSCEGRKGDQYGAWLVACETCRGHGFVALSQNVETRMRSGQLV